MDQYQYKAFISYRHYTPDQEIAQKLHSYIENYRIPGAVKASSGITKMGRVFRDQEELPLSSNLGDDIRNALDHSEWLILICSPRYIESKWCNAELDYYLSLGRRDHILTLLVEGEPEDSFPEQIRFEETDGEKREIEPLAADVRGADLAESLKKLKEEKLRILSPMLHVNYDDLRQRAKRRKTRMIASAAAAVIAVLAVFLAFVLFKNQEIQSERDSSLISQSKYLSSRSEEALNSGDRMLALLLAREALPGSSSVPDRPLIAEASSALYSAMLYGNGADIYQGICVIDTEGTIRQYGSSDSMLAILDKSAAEPEDYFRYYDLDTGKRNELRITPTGDPVGAGFNTTLIPEIFYQDHMDHYTTNMELTTSEFPHLEDYTPGWKYKRTEYSFAYLSEEYLGLQYMYFGLDMFSAEDLGTRVLYDVVPANNSDATYFVLMNAYGDNKNMVVEIDVMHASASSLKKGEFTHTYSAGEESPADHLSISYDNEAICAHGLANAFLWRVESENLIRVLRYEDFSDYFQQIEFIPQSKEQLMAINCGSAVYIYDYGKGEVVRQLDLGFSNVTHIEWNTDGTRILATCEDQCARVYSAETGEELVKLQADFDVKEAAYAAKTVFGHASSDATILLVGSSKVAVYSSSLGSGTGLLTQLEDYDPYHDYGAGEFSADGSKVWYVDATTYYTTDLLHLADAETGKILKTFEQDDLYQIRRIGNTLIAYGYDENGKTVVYFIDSNDGTVLEMEHPVYSHVVISQDTEIDRSDRFSLHHAVISPNEKYLKFSSSDQNMFEEDEAYVFLYDIENRKELWHTGIENARQTRPADLGFAEEKDYEPEMVMVTADFLDDTRMMVRYRFGIIGPYGYEIRDILTGTVLYRSRLLRDVWFVTKEFAQSGQGYYVLKNDQTEDGEGTCVLEIFDLMTGEPVGTFESGESVYSNIHPQPDGKTFEIYPTGYRDTKTIYRWNSETGQTETVILEQLPSTKNEEEQPFLFGDRLVIASSDGLLDVETEEVVFKANLAGFNVEAAADDGQSLLIDYKLMQEHYYAVLRYADLDQLLSESEKILNGRELTKKEKETFFIE